MPIHASVTAAHHLASKSRAHALVFFVRPNPELPDWFQEEEPLLWETLQKLIQTKEVNGKIGNVVVLHALDRPYQRVVTCGLGEKQNPRSLMNAFANLARELRTKAITDFSVVLPDYLFPEETPQALSRLLAGAGTISCYSYHRFQKNPEPLHEFHSEFITRTEAEAPEVERLATRGVDLGKAVVYSRDLCNLPGNFATPRYIADQAQQMVDASEGRLDLTVLGPEEMKSEGMNLLLAVSAGSDKEPRLICLDYNGAPETQDRIVVVGKCITFDAGGLSIKPSKGMMQMKRDKMGGTNTLGLASCISSWQPKLNVTFVIPAAENMPDGRAYRPGDCYQAMNGTWVEINSTDAEGRLVLADALTWAQRYREPRVILDMATLTGGAQMALGGSMIATFANHEGLWDKLERASRSSQEDLWRLPLYQPYKKGVRSYFAATKNSSTTPPSTIKAALFLEEWIGEGIQWAHLDIAASMSQNRPSGILTRGATGMGLVLVADVLEFFEAEGF
jgi:leucyl aminopeptidase